MSERPAIDLHGYLTSSTRTPSVQALFGEKSIEPKMSTNSGLEKKLLTPFGTISGQLSMGQKMEEKTYSFVAISLGVGGPMGLIHPVKALAANLGEIGQVPRAASLAPQSQSRRNQNLCW